MPQLPNGKRLVENKEPEGNLNQRIAERISGPKRAPVSSWLAFHLGEGLYPGLFRAF